MDEIDSIEVAFGSSFNFELDKAMEKAISGKVASVEYIEDVRFKWNHVALSPNARERLRALAYEIGTRLVDSGIQIGYVSPLKWEIVTVDQDDISEFLLELRCWRFGKLLLTVELLLDEDAHLVEFATEMLKRSAKKKRISPN